MTDDIDFLHQPVDTGFDLVTAAVTEKEPEVVGLTPEGKNAMKGLLAVPHDKATPQFLMQVALDFAMDIHSEETILQKHGLSNAQYEYLREHNEFFKQALSQQAREWQRLGSTQERLRAEAAAALEAHMPTIASRMGSPSEKLSDVVEAAKLIAKVAGVDTSPDRSGPAGEGFEIVIDLGADNRVAVRPRQDAGANAKQVGPGAVRTDGSGQSGKGPILKIA